MFTLNQLLFQRPRCVHEPLRAERYHAGFQEGLAYGNDGWRNGITRHNRLSLNHTISALRAADVSRVNRHPDMMSACANRYLLSVTEIRGNDEAC
ncbi:unnamed protein product [Boreogadus saida]